MGALHFVIESAYVKTLNIVKETENSNLPLVEYDEIVSQAIIDFMQVVGKYNRKYEFLDTVLRDEVISAVDVLMQNLSEQTILTISTFVESEMDD